MLILARKTNERIIIGDDIEVSVIDIKGDQVKLGIQAPNNVKVYRQEVFEAIQAENRSAAMTANRDLPELAGLSEESTSGSEQAGADTEAEERRGNRGEPQEQESGESPDNDAGKPEER